MNKNAPWFQEAAAGRGGVWKFLKPASRENLIPSLYQGQIVWQHSQDDAKAIEWNIGELGITSGIYVYRLQMKTATTSVVSQTGKIIVTK